MKCPNCGCELNEEEEDDIMFGGKLDWETRKKLQREKNIIHSKMVKILCNPKLKT